MKTRVCPKYFVNGCRLNVSLVRGYIHRKRSFSSEPVNSMDGCLNLKQKNLCERKLTSCRYNKTENLLATTCVITYSPSKKHTILTYKNHILLIFLKHLL